METATLSYMPTEHLPVLAPELIELIAPQPGELAVDCTFGGGGHARLIADRIGPTGTLVCIDRDPAAEQRFADFAARIGPTGTLVCIDRDPAAEQRFADFAAGAPCQTRFIRDDYVAGLQALL